MNPCNLTNPSDLTNPRNLTNPCDLTARAARRLIGNKRLSAVELLDSCLDRIRAVNPAVNAIVAMDEAGARAQAERADQAVRRGDTLGPLHGLPVGIKDTEDAAGLPTTFGSPLFRRNIASHDHRTTAAIRAAGGIVLGKTNVPEFAAGANTRNAVFGATGNPFDPMRSAAGSSGGSAVALACGMLPLATGSDLGGSLRNPAAFCGIVGFRPSPGLVPAEARQHGWSGLSVLGPMARNVADTALLLSAMAGHEPRDPFSAPIDATGFAALPEIDLASIRAAFTPDFGFAPTENGVRAAFAEKTALFRAVLARGDDATPDCTGADRAFEVLRAIGMVAAHQDKCRDHPGQVGPNIRANVEEGLRYTAVDVADAMTAQTVLYRRWQEFFAEYDVVITPAITISPRPWTELYPSEIDGRPTRTYFHWLALSYAVTLAGHPAVALPCGLDGQGMPFGLQIVGRRGADRHVLAVAAAFERYLAWDGRTARPVPDLTRLRSAPPLSSAPGFLGF